jgi:CarD family transcriptional regulator
MASKNKVSVKSGKAKKPAKSAKKPKVKSHAKSKVATAKVKSAKSMPTPEMKRAAPAKLARKKPTVVAMAKKPSTDKKVKVVAAAVKPAAKSATSVKAVDKKPVASKTQSVASMPARIVAPVKAQPAPKAQPIARPAPTAVSPAASVPRTATPSQAPFAGARPIQAPQPVRTMPAAAKPFAQKSGFPLATPKQVAERVAAAQHQQQQAAAAQKKPVNQRHGFKKDEFIVYPAHGVGRITGIEEQEIAGMSLELFVIEFEKDKMTLRVPTGKLASVGMRKLAEENVVHKAMETLKGRARIKRTMWSRRAQEYEAKINSGDLVSIAEVVRDLYRSEQQPEQSYSERQLYEQALDRMAREIAAVDKIDERGAVQRITEVLSKSAKGRRLAAEGAETEAEEVKAA